MSAPTLTREEFRNLVTSHGEACKRYGFSTYRTTGRKFLPQVEETSAALLAAYDALAAERDEWKRRAEEAQTEAVRIAQVYQHQWVMAASDREGFVRLVDSLIESCIDGGSAFAPYRQEKAAVTSAYAAALARATKAEEERDAALKRVGVRGLDPATLRECDAALDLTDDPRIEAWRALDAEQRRDPLHALKLTLETRELAAAASKEQYGDEGWWGRHAGYIRTAIAALEALDDLAERP